MSKARARGAATCWSDQNPDCVQQFGLALDLTSSKNACWAWLVGLRSKASEDDGNGCLEGAWTAGRFWIPHNSC